MEDGSLYAQWYFWLIVAAVLVVAAATLLILVIYQARRILKHALTALTVVKEIKENTMPVWDLQKTNEVALGILAKAEDIKSHTGLVATSLPKNQKD